MENTSEQKSKYLTLALLAHVWANRGGQWKIRLSRR